MPGATALLYAPLLNFSIEQWCMVVINTENALFVTSPYDVIFRFANQLLVKFVETACILFYMHFSYSVS